MQTAGDDPDTVVCPMADRAELNRSGSLWAETCRPDAQPAWPKPANPAIRPVIRFIHSVQALKAERCSSQDYRDADFTLLK
jgi:hypothetical protein